LCKHNNTLIYLVTLKYITGLSYHIDDEYFNFKSFNCIHIKTYKLTNNKRWCMKEHVQLYMYWIWRIGNNTFYLRTYHLIKYTIILIWGKKDYNLWRYIYPKKCNIPMSLHTSHTTLFNPRISTANNIGVTNSVMWLESSRSRIYVCECFATYYIVLKQWC